jgi:hypothetical protein
MRDGWRWLLWINYNLIWIGMKNHFFNLVLCLVHFLHFSCWVPIDFLARSRALGFPGLDRRCLGSSRFSSPVGTEARPVCKGFLVPLENFQPARTAFWRRFSARADWFGSDFLRLIWRSLGLPRFSRQNELSDFLRSARFSSPAPSKARHSLDFLFFFGVRAGPRCELDSKPCSVLVLAPDLLTVISNPK